MTPEKEIVITVIILCVVVVFVVAMIIAFCEEVREWLVDRYDKVLFKKRMKRWYNFQLSFADKKGLLNAIRSFEEEVLIRHFYNAGGPLSKEHLQYFFEPLYVFKDRVRRNYRDEEWVLMHCLCAYYNAKRDTSRFVTFLTNMGYIEEKNHSYIFDLQLDFLREKYEEYIKNNDLCILKIKLTRENAKKYSIAYNQFSDIQQNEFLICKRGEEKSTITTLNGNECFVIPNDRLDEFVELI